MSASALIRPAPLPAAPDRFGHANRRRLSAPGLRAFGAIADLWGLSETERRLILGLPARSTYHHWVRLAREHQDLTLDLDVLTRISAVLGIHQALGVLFPLEADSTAWLRGAHQAPVFGGAAPLSLMACGTQDGLLSVRRFLDAATAGRYMPPGALDHDLRPYTDAEIVLA